MEGFHVISGEGCPLIGSALDGYEVNGNNGKRCRPDGETGDLDGNRLNADEKNRWVIREEKLLVGLKVSGRAMQANEWFLPSFCARTR
ncbi:hypothetical protein M378DRAFT_166334 [Amanita muscaria Koide BX008]|uniref:Uncharacterized protein n=1 Tax=Amanita muscaria (strain Koide BX008) TaxID=946122 RepID=A0A0C2SFJ5_AMAMK|nr:hypothetical protein M378DRAFT_166334 [Amanita muscaria Koide BX008]